MTIHRTMRRVCDALQLAWAQGQRAGRTVRAQSADRRYHRRPARQVGAIYRSKAASWRIPPSRFPPVLAHRLAEQAFRGISLSAVTAWARPVLAIPWCASSQQPTTAAASPEPRLVSTPTLQPLLDRLPMELCLQRP